MTLKKKKMGKKAVPSPGGTEVDTSIAIDRQQQGEPATAACSIDEDRGVFLCSLISSQQ